MSKRLGEGHHSSEGNDTTNTSASTDEEELNSETQTPRESHNRLDIPIPVRNAAGGTVMDNDPNDEVYRVSDDRNIRTPPVGQRNPSTSLGAGALASAGVGSGAAGGGEFIPNNPNDERLPVRDADVIPTPRAHQTREYMDSGVVNDSHDEIMSADRTDLEPPAQRVDETESEESEEDEEPRMRNIAGQRPDAIGETETTSGQPVLTNLEYNPAAYAKVNATASREMQDLFRHILDYQPFVAELPAKLRPFVPDYIPAIGDLDPFAKVPRPDGRPDGLGLYVIDEPTIPQSNPAVVQLELRATNVHGAGSSAQVVDSFEDAANRPEVIDRWISDVKKVHYKKPLPTVNYQRPMPEIETLMQLWPSEFEDLLNSDVQFPPSNIDLDIDQYVRTLCAIADIPTYNSLIDSLHVMFTLYEDFRGNQHFQHE